MGKWCGISRHHHGAILPDGRVPRRHPGAIRSTRSMSMTMGRGPRCDALLVINELNRVRSHLLLPPAGSQSPSQYLDVSGDNYVSAIDALLVINSLNRHATYASGLRHRVGSGSSLGGGSMVAAVKAMSGESEKGQPSSRAGDHAVAAAQSDSECPVLAAPSIPVAGSLPLGALSGDSRQRAVEEALRLFAADVAKVRQKSMDLLGTDTSLLPPVGADCVEPLRGSPSGHTLQPEDGRLVATRNAGRSKTLRRGAHPRDAEN